MAGLALLPPLAAQAGRDGASRFFQDGASPNGERAEQLERFIEIARTGAPAVRPQAADRLAAMGPAAAERLLTECGDTPEAMAELGADLVEVLARFGDPRLRAKLWEAVDAADFPWRPAAARALAAAPRADEAERFDALLGDALAAVRVAALGALDEQAPATRVALHGLLADEDDRVRRAAAVRLHALGEAWALLWPLEDLRRTDRYFELETGRIARFESARVLRERLGDLAGYQPARDPDDPGNARALEELEERIRAAIDVGAPPLPPVARAAEPLPTGDFGVELRSCREGELFLQWGPGDDLWVGLGNPRRIPLAPGAVEGLAATAAAARAAVGETRQFGTPGCDVECLRVGAAGGSVDAFWLRKGPEPRPELRPASLDRFVRALVASVPAEEPELRARLVRGLEAVGGPFGAPAAATD